MKCVNTGLYFNPTVNKLYYIQRLKNGGLFIKTIINNNGRICVQNCNTINKGQVFFNGGLPYSTKINPFLL